MTTTMPMDKIRLVILDDHPIIRHSIRIVIENASDIEMVGSFGHSSELFTWLRDHDCDVLLLDYILHSDELDGLSFIKQLLSHNPNIKILLFSSMESLAVIRTAFMLGVRGYIAKRELPAVYLQAIRSVAYGHRHVPDEIALELAQVPARKRDAAIINGSEEACIASLTKLLTPREAEVIYSFLEGMSLTEIAAKLKRSRKTISGHKQSGMRKLGVSSDLELFKYRNDLFK